MIEAEWDMGSCRNRGLSHVSLDHVLRLNKAWGRETFEARYGAAWQAFATWAVGAFSFEDQQGVDAVDATYQRLIKGDVSPHAAMTLVPAGE